MTLCRSVVQRVLGCGELTLVHRHVLVDRSAGHHVEFFDLIEIRRVEGFAHGGAELIARAGDRIRIQSFVDFPQRLVTVDCERKLCLELVNLTREDRDDRSEEHTSELQSLMRISYAVFCLKK